MTDCPTCDRDHPRGAPECPGQRVGTVFHGKYELVRVLGCGGMGAVYEARHVQLGRACAIKIMLASIAGHAAAGSRFETEAKQVAALEHPGIVRIYDAGHDASGTRFIEMELLRGQSVEAWAATRPPVTACVDMIARALDALDEAHRNRIIHRDIKPDNIFIAPQRDGSTRVVLLDFGIARDIGDDDVRRTSEGSTMGTLSYMSPEQFADASTVDMRTDLFAMAATLFRLLTGRPPVDGTRTEVVRALAAGDYPRWPRAFSAEVPATLDEVIASALDPDPAKRPRDAATLRGLLATAVAGVRDSPRTASQELAATELPGAPTAPARPSTPASTGGGPVAVAMTLPASMIATAQPQSPRLRVVPALALGSVVVAGIFAATRVFSGNAPIADPVTTPVHAVRDASVDAIPSPPAPPPTMARIVGATFELGVGDVTAFRRWCGVLHETDSTCTEMLDCDYARARHGRDVRSRPARGDTRRARGVARRGARSSHGQARRREDRARILTASSSRCPRATRSTAWPSPERGLPGRVRRSAPPRASRTSPPPPTAALTMASGYRRTPSGRSRPASPIIERYPGVRMA